ncbi:hypothetical protein LCGC14_1661460 [marine sediment metagenome]|uniref:Uncharacterized protein n=1 Tax=marine sediment metagenome TaxID=412755 RepID=A0A0F9HUM4_9ZZZZ
MAVTNIPVVEVEKRIKEWLDEEVRMMKEEQVENNDKGKL